MAPRKLRQKVKQQKQSQQTPKPPKRHKKHNSNRSLYISIGVIAVVVVVIAAIVVLSLGNGGTNDPSASPTPIPSSTDPYENSTFVFFHTTKGNFTVSLRNDMPITTGNFIDLVNRGVYNGSTFHRVISGFMIQGGIPADGSSVSTIPDEFTDTNRNSNMTIAMANTGAPNSGSSQFFINVADNTYRYSTFDTSYVSFGKIIFGQDTVMDISKVPTNANDAPLEEVTIISAKVLNI
jgi:peptidylprolyl isomerase